MIRTRPVSVHRQGFGPAPFLADPWLALALVLSALTVGLMLAHARLMVAVTPALILFAAWATIATATCYVFRTSANARQCIARDFVEGVSLFILVSLMGAVATYPLAAGTHPLVDAQLERIDLALHFRWLDWYMWIAARPWLQALERAAYLSIFVTPAFLIGYFAWTGRRAETRLFVATFWVAALITLALFPLMPAAGPLATLSHGAAPYMPLSALYQDEVITALRQHAVHSIDIGELHGLVCAPSFHAASAVIYIGTAIRIRLLRWPILVTNGAMLLATPVEGTHYLADLLAGIAVACLALWITPAIIRWTERNELNWRAAPGDMASVAAE